MKWILLLWVVLPQPISTTGTVSMGTILQCVNGICQNPSPVAQCINCGVVPSNMRSVPMDRETCIKAAEAVMALNADVRAACQPGRE